MIIKNDIIIRYKNGVIKYWCRFHLNGNINAEYYNDKRGYYHRRNHLPAVSEFYSNGYTYYLSFRLNGYMFNCNNPVNIIFEKNGKIRSKDYCHHNVCSRIVWLNNIKNI